MNRYRKFLLTLNFVLLAVLALDWQASVEQGRREGLRVSFLEIGQGDATLIDYQGEYQILVDGGPNGRRLLTQLGEVMPAGDKQIEMVILTHPDKDHLGGLTQLIDSYQVELFLNNGQSADTAIYSQLQEELKQHAISQEVVGEGSVLTIGREVRIEFFAPDHSLEEEDDRNENSLVFRLDYGQKSFLFTGDAEREAEEDLVSDQEDIDVDFLKIAHHGSKGATSEIFLSKVTPEIAVISAGKENRYGHPHQEVLSFLEEEGVEIFRTDQRGRITFDCPEVTSECKVITNL
jgi:competence protein ComEC